MCRKMKEVRRRESFEMWPHASQWRVSSLKTMAKILSVELEMVSRVVDSSGLSQAEQLAYNIITNRLTLKVFFQIILAPSNIELSARMSHRELAKHCRCSVCAVRYFYAIFSHHLRLTGIKLPGFQLSTFRALIGQHHPCSLLPPAPESISHHGSCLHSSTSCPDQAVRWSTWRFYARPVILYLYSRQGYSPLRSVTCVAVSWRIQDGESGWEDNTDAGT